MQPTTVTDLMRRFAARTGLLSGTGQPRHLWTDAFAVCTPLELDRSGADPEAGDLALRLIDAVHHVLGRHRDARRGELADVAVRHFSYRPAPGAARRMYWKMSIDLSRPQVRSMGQHDPLDGYLTCLQLRASGDGCLADPIETLASVVAGGSWLADDAGGHSRAPADRAAYPRVLAGAGKSRGIHLGRPPRHQRGDAGDRAGTAGIPSAGPGQPAQELTESWTSDG